MIRESRPFKAMLLAFFGFGFLSMMDALMKWQTSSYGFFQIVMARGLFSLIFFMGFHLFNKKRFRIRTAIPKQLVLRSVIGFIAFSMMVYAFSKIPLVEATSITFSMPLLITALSYPLLKEKVTLHQWLAVIIGFMGVMVILQPGKPLNLGAIFAVLGALFFALYRIYTRYIGANESAFTMSFWSFMVWMILGFALSFNHFVWPSPQDILIFSLIGIFGGIAEILLAEAAKIAAPTVSGQFQYTMFLWSGLWGYLLWGDHISMNTAFGAGIIVLAGLYMVYFEWRARMPGWTYM